MSFHAISPAGFPQLKSCARWSKWSRALERAQRQITPSTVICLCNRRAMAANFRSHLQIKLLPPLLLVVYPVFAWSQLRGPWRRLAALGLLLRILRPLGVSVPPQASLRTTAKSHVQTSFGPLPEDRLLALGSRVHSLSSAHM